jgi:hypothetical protein
MTKINKGKGENTMELYICEKLNQARDLARNLNIWIYWQ